MGSICSFSLASGTRLTINLRPAEWTTCADGLGGMPKKRQKSETRPGYVMTCSVAGFQAKKKGVYKSVFIDFHSEGLKVLAAQ